ncbi:50S ribosomal protein L25/general stress protein Ctc [Anoxybacillus flavithermus]|uniref:Large ribosomal subunit protein bL25 n=1 Tax=Anoxybacillus flavithermus AK1 TaxID=1297581 RepID=M8CUT6_9BACL|nr:50S ribosomal protein L25/general stress protein Ctc [Anoxybacillus flavithermus]EMT45293.1 50S ribosomal protein L25/general stress protein Ctc [Anoxybacillus flavithermus AK1]MBW7651616.1 50S ribosomal protein L25/general stress protein Ctc [Anoxybacillus sp. ST4]
MISLLQLQLRTDHRRSYVKQMRKQGRIPAIVYGKKTNSQPVFVDAAEFSKQWRATGGTGLLDVQVNDDHIRVIVRDMQKHPIRHDIIHIDFLAVDAKTKIDVSVPIHLVGEAAGVKDGGVLQQAMHQLSIRALPTNIPSSIDIDITNLQVGDVLTISHIQTNGAYEVNHDPTEVIASILPPKQEEEIHSGEEQEPGKPESEEGRETTP